MDTGRWAACAAALLLALPARAGARVEPRLRLIAETKHDGQLMSKLIPQAGLTVAGRTFEVGGWYSPDLLLRHGSGTFTVDHRGALSLEKAFSGRVRMDARLRLWRVADSTSLPRPGLAREVAPVFYGRAEISSRLRLTGRWTAGVGYELEGAQIQDGRAEAGWVQAPYADAWYRLGRRTDLGVEYRFQHFSLGPEQALAHSATVAARHRFTRQLHAGARAGPGLYLRPGEPGVRPYPRASVELGRDGERVDLSLAAGHDLVGASGFASALWADHASARVDWRVAGPLRLHLAASYFRNGPAPDQGWAASGGAGGSEGYAAGGGVEWRLRRDLALQLSASRYSQIGLTRDVIAARLVATPFQAGPDREW